MYFYAKQKKTFFKTSIAENGGKPKLSNMGPVSPTVVNCLDDSLSCGNGKT